MAKVIDQNGTVQIVRADEADIVVIGRDKSEVEDRLNEIVEIHSE